MLLSHGSKVASNGDLLARNNLLTRSLGFHMLIIGKKTTLFLNLLKFYVVMSHRRCTKC